jgi:hypothetical protein
LKGWLESLGQVSSLRDERARAVVDNTLKAVGADHLFRKGVKIDSGNVMSGSRWVTSGSSAAAAPGGDATR